VSSRSPAQTFGTNVRLKREGAGLSQEELADLAGLHRTYISSLERGKRNVSIENIFAIAKALGCRPGELLQTADE
jgi:transcriptional regulator with XRE-family HTH domain